MNYDSIAQQYDEWGKQAITDWELGHKNVAKLLEPLKEKKILDFGCGGGKFSKYLAKLGADVVGVDTSEKQLEVARKTSDPTIQYFLDTDPVVDSQYSNYFDAGVMVFVLCEISSQEIIAKVLSRVSRLLKTGSDLVILNPNWEKSNGKEFLTHQLQYQSELKIGGPVTTILKGNPPIHVPDYFWTKDIYLEHLKEAGFGNFEIFEPLAPDDGNPWKDEKEFPPFLIIKAKKL